MIVILVNCFFFFNDTATTEIYTLSLHDALPIFPGPPNGGMAAVSQILSPVLAGEGWGLLLAVPDRKSTRLNSSHSQISYAVFCLKKKKTIVFLCPPATPPSLECITGSRLVSTTV